MGCQYHSNSLTLYLRRKRIRMYWLTNVKWLLKDCTSNYTLSYSCWCEIKEVARVKLLWAFSSNEPKKRLSFLSILHLRKASFFYLRNIIQPFVQKISKNLWNHAKNQTKNDKESKTEHCDLNSSLFFIQLMCFTQKSKTQNAVWLKQVAPLTKINFDKIDKMTLQISRYSMKDINLNRIKNWANLENRYHDDNESNFR